MLTTWISLTHTHTHTQSLSSIALGRSSKLHPVFAQRWCKLGLAGRLTLACSCVQVHRRTSIISSLLLIQQCSTCLVWKITTTIKKKILVKIHRCISEYWVQGEDNFSKLREEKESKIWAKKREKEKKKRKQEV